MTLFILNNRNERSYEDSIIYFFVEFFRFDILPITQAGVIEYANDLPRTKLFQDKL